MGIPMLFNGEAVYPDTSISNLSILDPLLYHASHPQGSTSFTAEITENTTHLGVFYRLTQTSRIPNAGFL